MPEPSFERTQTWLLCHCLFGIFFQSQHPYLWRFQLHRICFKSCRSCSIVQTRRAAFGWPLPGEGRCWAAGDLCDLVGLWIPLRISFTKDSNFVEDHGVSVLKEISRWKRFHVQVLVLLVSWESWGLGFYRDMCLRWIHIRVWFHVVSEQFLPVYQIEGADTQKLEHAISIDLGMHDIS